MSKKSINGPGYLGAGFKLLLHPQLRWLVLIPLLINLVIFVGLTAYAFEQFSLAINWVMSFIPSWLNFLSWLLWIISTLLLLVIYGYSFAILATFIASPFYGLLAERAEILLTGVERDEPLTFKAALIIAKRSVIRELVKMGYFLPRILLVLLTSLALTFIPGLGLLAPVVTFGWGAWSLALQYTDYAADNNLVAFSALRKQMSKEKTGSFSLGGTILIATSIPLINLFAIPASVVAGTAFWLDQQEGDDPF